MKETDITDITRLVMFVAGIALIAFGAWLVYPPAGFISGGVLMFVSAVIGAVRVGSKR